MEIGTSCPECGRTAVLDLHPYTCASCGASWPTLELVKAKTYRLDASKIETVADVASILEVFGLVFTDLDGTEWARSSIQRFLIPIEEPQQ